MLKSSSIIILLHILFLFHGCSSFEYSYGNSKNGRKIEMTKDEMLDEIEKLKIENQRLRTRLRTQINIHNQENQRIKNENKILETNLAALQNKYDTASSESNELKRDRPKVKMKVLSGDGDLNSAREMSKKLRNMGYETGIIHHALRSDFTHNIVYYKPQYEDIAKRLVLDLWGNTFYKPLTWPSAFDIMVVTGKKL